MGPKEGLVTDDGNGQERKGCRSEQMEERTGSENLIPKWR